MPWYAGKGEIRDYLTEVNKHEKVMREHPHPVLPRSTISLTTRHQVLEYCLFQPGLFTNYFTYPYESAKHFRPFETQIDFNNRRAIIVDGGVDDRITLTTAQDFANVVALAVDYEGEWPVVGGIKGTDITIGQLLAVGEKIRGMSMY